ncbi:serine/threonine protein kinase [Scheffersomyces coipomensis]|uniref:serine/threonine protein kinase n=1 Tax=Scheffersomyces coipomensis TaxID=1788519 RepID=UPI00315D3F5F
MNGATRLINDQNRTAQLAAQFNDFYLQITSPSISQIGNYRIIEEIGEGAFGKVYLAKHILLNINVVLKCGLVEDPNIVREIYYHKQLKHKNIVTLYEVIKTEQHLWLVLEYCEGSELYYLIYEKKRIPIEECQHIFFQIVLGLKYVHSLNLSHRDLKLENILFADKKKTLIKLTDFGFVREFNPQSRKFLSTVCGTTVYMAPELLKGEKYSGFAVDIWSLGVILYTMVYGQLPFDFDDDLKNKFSIIHEEPSFPDFIPSHIIDLITKMLQKDPQQRPDLNEILNSEFLIDLNNKHLRKVNKNKMRLETESIISIHQHYQSNNQPFQSKTEREVVKKLEKLNVDIDDLQRGVYTNEMNPLTSFYELLLTEEYKKKKLKYYREKKKRYYDAKRTLKKSRKRVKSALSLVDQATGGVASSAVGGQPLERILSTLSLSSNRNSSKTNIHKLTSERRKSTDISEKRIESQSTKNSDFLNPTALVSTPTSSTTKIAPVNSASKKEFYIPESPPSADNRNRTLTRVISFVPDEKARKPSIASSITNNDRFSKRRNRNNNNFLEKIQFWKKQPKNADAPDTSSNSGQSLPKSSTDYSNNNSNHYNNGVIDKVTPSTSRSLEKSINNNNNATNTSPNGVAEGLRPAFTLGGDLNKPDNPIPRESFEEDNKLISPAYEQPATPPVAESFVRSTRTRPTSIVSQISQMSHFSQMSTMLSESELDILDETDTMDEDYEEDDDAAYESSISVSQDFTKNSSTGLTPSGSVATSNSSSKPLGGGHVKKKRPGYKRALSSDLSIQSASTTATVSKQHAKKFSLSQLSSNSSEESSIKSNTFVTPVPNKMTPSASSDNNTLNTVNTLEQTLNNPTFMARSNSPDFSKLNKKRWKNPIFSNSISSSNNSLNNHSDPSLMNSGPGLGPSFMRSQSPPPIKGPMMRPQPFDSKSNSNSPAPAAPSPGLTANPPDYFMTHQMDTKWETSFDNVSHSIHSPRPMTTATTTTTKTTLYGPVINEEEEGDF